MSGLVRRDLMDRSAAQIIVCCTGLDFVPLTSLLSNHRYRFVGL